MNPFPGEPKFLKKRKKPKAIRFYKVKANNNPARFFLQELMFYTCYNEETYNRWHDDDICCAEYLRKQNEIRLVKSQIMEWIDLVDEARYYVEQVLKDNLPLDDIGDELDAEGKQEDSDCNEEGIIDDPRYQHLDLGNHNELDFVASSNWCKKIDLKEEDQILKDTRNLDKNQRKVLDIGLNYAKSIVKARSSSISILEAPNLIVIGGAGSGKSTVINSLKQ